ncbi:LPS-induced tumor necrosis factor alpha factor domain-containing protein [Strongyloides ratti]|uniref:LPS-induced tumor necrosis factor alpha factor domain-containing protein n=1 Tax=Strongyloides ratti TaxID=34506 RepID=A0A090L4Y5_STRRB|nr:LPS-induced tumor necrosis factor alpha factor domain-containing protein [Strongyloides ratti]CEF64767.1 LPS-induced tumor necrosis factor alpha factor domain-containing protein [Strongyloides ratti]
MNSNFSKNDSQTPEIQSPPPPYFNIEIDGDEKNQPNFVPPNIIPPSDIQPNQIPLNNIPPNNIPLNNIPPNNILPTNNLPNQFAPIQHPPILNPYTIVVGHNCGRYYRAYPRTRYPSTLYCFNCNKYVLSIIHYERGQNYKKNWLIMLLLCLICPPFLCVLPIILLTNVLNNVIHKCPDCGTVIGIHLANG